MNGIKINYLQNYQSHEWLRRNKINIQENQGRIEMNRKINEDVEPIRTTIKPMIDYSKYFNRK